MSEPVIKLSDRGLSIGVFEYKNQDGSVNMSCNIQRSYKKKDAQEWTRENINCYDDDLLKIANLCTETYNAIRAKKCAAKQAKPTPTPAPSPAPAPAPAPADDPLDEIPF